MNYPGRPLPAETSPYQAMADHPGYFVWKPANEAAPNLMGLVPALVTRSLGGIVIGYANDTTLDALDRVVDVKTYTGYDWVGPPDGNFPNPAHSVLVGAHELLAKTMSNDEGMALFVPIAKYGSAEASRSGKMPHMGSLQVFDIGPGPEDSGEYMAGMVLSRSFLATIQSVAHHQALSYQDHGYRRGPADPDGATLYKYLYPKIKDRVQLAKLLHDTAQILVVDAVAKAPFIQSAQVEEPTPLVPLVITARDNHTGVLRVAA